MNVVTSSGGLLHRGNFGVGDLGPRQATCVNPSSPRFQTPPKTQVDLGMTRPPFRAALRLKHVPEILPIIAKPGTAPRLFLVINTSSRRMPRDHQEPVACPVITKKRSHFPRRRM